MKSRRKVLQYLLLVSIAICAALSVSYAYFALGDDNYIASSVSTPSAYGLLLSSTDSVINVSGDFATPVSESKALSSTALRYEFSVTNSLSDKSNLDILLAPATGNTMPISAVKYALYEIDSNESKHVSGLGEYPVIFSEKEQREVYNRTSENITTGYSVLNGLIDGNETKNYYLYVWIDYNLVSKNNIDVVNKELKLHIIVLPQGKSKLNNSVAAMASDDDGASVIENNGYRYVGQNPNNYVLFNNELWRIVGVFDEEYDTDGDNIPDSYGLLTKIVRNDSIGSFSWDNKQSGVGSSYQNGAGSNDWSDAQLMHMLNPKEFINSGYLANGNLSHSHTLENGYVKDSNGKAYYLNPGSYLSYEEAYEPVRVETTSSFSENIVTIPKLLKDQGMIATTIWHLGQIDWSDIPTDDIYDTERGTTVHENYPIYWYGKVGLIYASDYGYATGGITTDSYSRNDCLSKDIVDYWDGKSNCSVNDWLRYIGSNSNELGEMDNQWMLTSYTDGQVTYIGSNGIVAAPFAWNPYAVRPSVYLKPNVVIKSGSGSSTDPYILSFDDVEPIVDKILSQNEVVERNTYNIDIPDETDGTLYSTNATDDNSTIYYYAGHNNTNWVVFGRFAEDGPVNGFKTSGYYIYSQSFNSIEECENSYRYERCQYLYKAGDYMYWKIMHTNTDQEGSGVRLIYAGSGPTTNIPKDIDYGYIVRDEIFNENNNKSEYVGFMYTLGEQHGHNISSYIKTYLENWYVSSGLINYDNYINKDAYYCNDRSLPSGTTWASTPSTSPWHYIGDERAYYSAPVENLTYRCGYDNSVGYLDTEENIREDRFSVTTKGGGNGYLTYPIAIASADEMKISNYTAYYNYNGVELANDNAYPITLTPSAKQSRTYTLLYNDGTSFWPGPVNSNRYAIRPVISLNFDVYATGHGTIDDPYIIVTN